jgi:hypothetical protein
MARFDKLMAIVITLALTVTVLPVLSTSAAPRPRAEGIEKPNWEVGDYWEYRNDATDSTPRAIFRITYSDYQTPGGPYDILTEMRFSAATQATQTKFTVVSINDGAKEYKLDHNNWTWENGTWALVVVDTGGDPGVSPGETVLFGPYKLTNKCVGEMYMDVNNLDLKRGTFSCIYKVDATGDLLWTEDINSNIVEATTNGIEAMLKPDWGNKPLQVHDKWVQSDILTIMTDLVYSFNGDIAGDGSMTTTIDYNWDFEWEVMSLGPKTIASTRYGTNRFDPAAQVVRSGGFDWYYTDDFASYSGHVNSAPYEYWYSCYGEGFDAGWFIELNYSTRILSSNHKCFRNSPPTFVAPPLDVIIINCDELWEFKNGIDYAVSDPDPGNAGLLSYSLKKSLGTNENVLLGLFLDPDTGDIEFTPLQHDVADGYTLTINVTDHYEKGPLSSEASFILNIRNKNHAPFVNQSLLEPIIMNEGDFYFPNWNLTQLMHDQDLDPNPLMGNQPYDPNEQLVYSVEGLGPLSLQCSNGQDFGPQHQCTKVRFYAPDGKFPKDTALKVNLTATDSFSMSARAPINFTIKHINHEPTLVILGPRSLSPM